MRLTKGWRSSLRVSLGRIRATSTAAMGFWMRPVMVTTSSVITPRGVLMPTFVLAISCVLASLYPAIRAARLRPAIGMRET